MQEQQVERNAGQPFFSVIVPIYQVEDCLRRCVDSILAQTFTAFELILVDDGSKDACPAICNEYQKTDRRVRVIHKQNGGLVSARNEGIRHAAGKYICYVDGDDWVVSELLEKVYWHLMQENEPDMLVFRAYYEFRDRRELIPEHVAAGRYEKTRLEREIYPFMIYDPSLPFFTGKVFPAAWNKVYRRELLEKHYCEEEAISLAEDNAFTFECLYYAETVIFCEEALYHYNRCNEQSMISRYDPEYLEKSMRMCRYVSSRLLGKEEHLEKQLHALFAGWLVMSVFHEVRHRKHVWSAAAGLRAKMKGRRELYEISLKGLPLQARCYIRLLRSKCYFGVCLLTRLVC